MKCLLCVWYCLQVWERETIVAVKATKTFTVEDTTMDPDLLSMKYLCPRGWEYSQQVAFPCQLLLKLPHPRSRLYPSIPHSVTDDYRGRKAWPSQLNSFFFFSSLYLISYNIASAVCIVFWPRGRWDLSSLTRDQTCTPCIGRQRLNHWTTRKSPSSTLNGSCSSETPHRWPFCLATA